MIQKKSKGFTLIEILIVIGIVSLLASIILASLSAAKAHAEDARRTASLKNIQVEAVDATDDGASSYAAAFASGSVADELQQLASLSNILPNDYDVRSDTSSYVVVFPLATSGYWCIDSNDISKKVDGRLNTTGANSCDNVSASGGVGSNGPAIVLTLAASPTYPMSGQEIQSIYLNYPSSAQSMVLYATLSGGTGNYNLTWERSGINDSNFSALAPGNTQTFTPTLAECGSNCQNDNIYTYRATATYDNGAVAQGTLRVNFVNPYVGDGNIYACHKVTVRGAPTGATTILSVGPSQIALHLAHGDYLGNCPVFGG